MKRIEWIFFFFLQQTSLLAALAPPSLDVKNRRSTAPTLVKKHIQERLDQDQEHAHMRIFLCVLLPPGASRLRPASDIRFLFARIQYPKEDAKENLVVKRNMESSHAHSYYAYKTVDSIHSPDFSGPENIRAHKQENLVGDYDTHVPEHSVLLLIHRLLVLPFIMHLLSLSEIAPCSVRYQGLKAVQPIELGG